MLKTKTAKQTILLIIIGVVLIIFGGIMFTKTGEIMNNSQTKLSTSILTTVIPTATNRRDLSNSKISVNCKTWFDGCNTCNRSAIGKPLACTKMACKGGNTAKPACREYFSKASIPKAPKISAPDNCKIWFDGCNTCNRDLKGGWICTKMACKGGNTAKPACREYFSKASIPKAPKISAPDNCKIWFDGCNTCNSDLKGGLICTKMACKGGNTAEPSCKEYFSDMELDSYIKVVPDPGNALENRHRGDEDGDGDGDAAMRLGPVRCGSANGKTFDDNNKPEDTVDNLCIVGTATTVLFVSHYDDEVLETIFSWECEGMSGDKKVSCKAGRISCGNGKVEADEECDDQNKENGDGCNEHCQNENSDVSLTDIPPEDTVIAVRDLNIIEESSNAKSSILANNINSNNNEDTEESRDDCNASIGNYIWYDTNGNGMQDDIEEGMPGIKVCVYNGNNKECDTTNSKGRYKIDDLCAHTYSVVVKDMDGRIQTYDPDGKKDSKTEVKVAEGDKHTKADFGYRGVAPATGLGTNIAVLIGVVFFLTVGALFVMKRRGAL